MKRLFALVLMLAWFAPLGAAEVAPPAALVSPAASSHSGAQDAACALPAGRERLRREARAAAALSHPGIATVYAIEEIDGRLYIAGEYVPGESLRTLVKAGPVPLEQVVDIGVQLARALGMKVMLGCMTETSCGISAAAHLSPMVDWADLDGALLIGNDVFDGAKVVDGKVVIPSRPGIGAVKIGA